VLLSVRDLTVRYGGVRAVNGLSFDIEHGTLVGLIGPNGAGKTSCIDALSGFTSATGTVALDGRKLDGVPPHQRARLGLSRTFQGSELFDDLDTRGNLLVAAARTEWWRPLADLVHPRSGVDGAASATVERAAAGLGIEHLLGRMTAELSEGERKLVGLARALVCSPRLLLLDEPAAGLDSGESRLLGERLRAIVDDGVTVLLVDHDMDLVLTVCDTVHVMVQGGLVASGPPHEVRADERVVAAYLGTGASCGP